MLSRGLLSGRWSKEALSPTDWRAMSPRFQAGNVDQNLALVEALRAEAKKRGASVAEIAIAWVLAIAGSLIILKIVDATIGLRVTKEQEIEGLDTSMHNEAGYIFEA